MLRSEHLNKSNFLQLPQLVQRIVLNWKVVFVCFLRNNKPKLQSCEIVTSKVVVAINNIENIKITNKN